METGNFNCRQTGILIVADQTTPNKVHTDLLGDLEFFDGMPSKGTVKGTNKGT